MFEKIKSFTIYLIIIFKKNRFIKSENIIIMFVDLIKKYN